MSSGQEDHVVIIEDLSSNGTYVNQRLIGKHKKTVLNNNDEIGLAQPSKKVFMFHDCLYNDAQQYPGELTAKYTIGKKIGEGTFGQVRLAYKQGNLQRCAVKILKKKQFSAAGNTLLMNNINQIQNEVQLLQSIDHNCIVRLWDVMDCPDRIYIVMELAEGGELFDRIKNSGRLSEKLSKLYCYQLAMALQHLHSLGITHRDLKPENILLSSDESVCCVKLTDFGLSKFTADCSAMSTFCGTTFYIAPELLEITKKISYCKKVDLWSYGVIIFVCLGGYPPFYDNNDLNLRYLIKTACYSFNKPLWKDVSEEAKDLIKHLLVPEPDSRYDIEKVLQHPWFQDEEMKSTAELVMRKAADQPTLSPTPPDTFSKPPTKRPLPPSPASPEAKRRMQDAITPRIQNNCA